MADGEFVTFDADAPKDSSPRLKPTPDAKAKKPSTESSPPLTEVFPDEVECPEVPCFLPYTCPPPPPPPCYCRKCQRHRKHAQGCNSGPGYGNPYLGWPGGYPGCYGPPSCPYQGCSCRKCRHKQGCGYGGCGYPGYGNPYGGGYGGGYGAMGYGGFMDGDCCGGMPYMAPPPPPPPPPCFCRKCRRKYGCDHHGGGSPGYGYPGYGYGGFMEGGFAGGCMPPPPPPPCPCRRCQRKHGCSYGYGYAGCGYPGWPAYPVPGANWDEGGYNSFTDPNCFGCSKHHHLFSRCKRNHGCHHTQPYPWYAYPPVMPCMMETEPCCMDCAGDGDFVPDLFPSGTSN